MYPYQQPAYAPPPVYQQAPGYGVPPGQPPYPNIGGAQPGPNASQPPPASQPPQAPPAAPMKKAVLIGCSYPGTSAALKGCINDIQCMKHCLMKHFGFQEQNIVMLRDDVYHPDWYSTGANIRRAITWLMSGQQPGMSLFFHFSGHGSQRRDFSGDEDDGMDETILPTDYKQAGQIVDDELNRLLVRPLMTGVTLHSVIDACHSGTVMDLPFRTKFKGPGYPMAWKGRYRPDKATYGGTAFQFGACRDSQVAQDTNRMSGYVYTGAATYSFIQAIETGGRYQSYNQLLVAMSHALHRHSGPPTNDLVTMAMGFLMGGGLSSGGQTPVLSCDKPFDINTRLML